MGPFWIEAFRYHRWANLHLLEVCSRLSDEQLSWSASGTYGSIADTWLHLLGAEQRYIRRFDGSVPTITEKTEFPGIAALMPLAERSADRLLEVAERAQPGDGFETDYDGRKWRTEAGVVLLQSLHHGNDHRTHICTILGDHGVSCGDMDVWAYGEATGALRPIGV